MASGDRVTGKSFVLFVWPFLKYHKSTKMTSNLHIIILGRELSWNRHCCLSALKDSPKSLEEWFSCKYLLVSGDGVAGKSFVWPFLKYQLSTKMTSVRHNVLQIIGYNFPRKNCTRFYWTGETNTASSIYFMPMTMVTDHSHHANGQPRWLSGLRRSRVHSLMICSSIIVSCETGIECWSGQ